MSQIVKAFSWNVNGLRAVVNRGDLQKFIQEFSPDILALQETKLNATQLQELKLAELFPDYQMFWSFAERKGYAGTALWVKTNLLNPTHEDCQDAPTACLEPNAHKNSPLVSFYEECAECQSLADQYGDAMGEGRLTAVMIGETLFVSLYSPNGKDDLSRIPLRVKYDAHVNNLLKPFSRVLLMGDFNVANEPIDVANPQSKKGVHGFTEEERSGFKNYLAAGLKDVWREENPEKVAYTWWSFRVRERGLNGWRIDYTLAKGIDARNAAIHQVVKGSDHCPISVEVKI